MLRLNIRVNQQMINLTGFTLKPPTLHYRNWNRGEAVKPIQTTNYGNWNLKDAKIFTPGRTGRWSWIELRDGPACDGNERNAFLLAVKLGLTRYCGFVSLPALDLLGINHISPFPTGSPLDVRRKLVEILQPYRDAKVQMLFVILSSQKISNYAAVKRVADVRVGIHTTAVVKVGRWFKGIKADPPKKKGGRPTQVRQLKHDDGVMGNILHKVNLRLGGMNTRLATTGERISRLFTSRTMIFGADVTHPGTGSKQNCPSITAVVASSD